MKKNRIRLTNFTAATVTNAPDQDIKPSGSDGGIDTAVSWSGVLAVEGVMTGDGRLMEPESLRWETPIPIRAAFQDIGGHDNAIIVGRIDTIERAENGRIEARGIFDTGSDGGREAARLVGERFMNGVSVDLDDVVFEIRVASELLEEDEGTGEILLAAAGDSGDERERETVMELNPDDELMVTTSARIRAATLVAIPAFSDAVIYLADDDEDEDDEEEDDKGESNDEDDSDDDDEDDEDDDEDEASVTASAAKHTPDTPPLSWFMNPKLTEPTPLEVTREGRVFGHIAAWGTCHTGRPQECVTAPKTSAGYAYFLTGMMLTADDEAVPVGTITMDTLHAGQRASASTAAAHYENTGAVAAYVSAGEDEHGIWIAGSLRPGLEEKQIKSLRAAPLSGDWRTIGGNLELIGVLAVNTPGFPIPRTSALVASADLAGHDGAIESLTAAGMIPPKRVVPPNVEGGLTVNDLRYLKVLVRRGRAADQAEKRRNLARVHAARVRFMNVKRDTKKG